MQSESKTDESLLTRTVSFFQGSEKYTFRAALFIQGCQIEELKAARREVCCQERRDRLILGCSFHCSSHFSCATMLNMSTNSWPKPKKNAPFGWKTSERPCKSQHAPVPISNNTLFHSSDRCSNPELTDNGHQFQMKSFDEINPRCDLCNRYLWSARTNERLFSISRLFSSGTFYQGYECARCQKKLHRECIKKMGPCFHRGWFNRRTETLRSRVLQRFSFPSSITRTYSKLRSRLDWIAACIQYHLFDQ